MCNSNSEVLLPFRRNVHLQAAGRWGQGGVVAIRQNGHDSSVFLPPALFDLLATLMLQACHPSCAGCPASSFLSPRELCARLRRRTTGTANALDPDPPHLVKYVFRLRRAVGDPGLLEHERFLGYRLSTPPENLDLVLLDGTGEETPRRPS
jgi:hypothetical protein